MRIFFLHILLCISSVGTAQVVTSQGKVYIQENSVVDVQGNFTNHASLTNEGDLTLRNNWNNQGEYISEFGLIELRGSQPQTFFHNNQSISQLKVNNPTQVLVRSSVRIENNLTLNNGLIQPANKAFFVLAEQATISGGSTASYINGTLYHTGTGQKFFPVGNDDIYSPVILNHISGNQPVVGLTFSEKRGFKNLNDEINVVTDFIWKQTVLSGEYTGSTITIESEWFQDLASYENDLVVTGVKSEEGFFQNFGNASFRLADNRYSITSYLPTWYMYVGLGVLKTNTRKLYIPNTFSLSATNPEDRTIKIYGNQIAPEDFLMIIHDAWGRVVFETRSIEKASQQGWAGENIRTNHQEHSSVFRYHTQGKFLNGETFKKDGTILLY